MGRNIINPHAVEKHVSRGGRLKTTDDPQSGCLATATGAEQREEFLIVDIEVDGVQHDLIIKHHSEIRQADELFGHLSSPVLSGGLPSQAPKSHEI